MRDCVHTKQSLATGVLLVDGREDFAWAVEGFLRRQPGLEIVGVLDPGQDPRVQVENLRPAVVLVDLEAPGLDSLAVIGRLREALPKPVVVALSLAEDDAHRQGALQAGADALVCKAQLVQDLVPAIRRAACLDWLGPPVPPMNPEP